MSLTGMDLIPAVFEVSDPGACNPDVFAFHGIAEKSLTKFIANTFFERIRLGDCMDAHWFDDKVPTLSGFVFRIEQMAKFAVERDSYMNIAVLLRD